MKMKRIVPWLVLALMVFMFLPVIVPRFSPFRAILTQLPFGWWHFLRHNWPQLTWNWSLIGTGVVCSAAIVVIGHWLLASLVKYMQAAYPSAPPPRTWRWRWTLGGYVALWLLFIAVFGATGVFRHATWLMNYNRPWYERRPSWADLEIVNQAIRLLAVENNGDLQATRRAFLREKSTEAGRWPMAEDFEVLFYGDQSNHVAAYVILRRDWPMGMKKQFYISISDSNFLLKPISELPQTISNLDTAFRRE